MEYLSPEVGSTSELLVAEKIGRALRVAAAALNVAAAVAALLALLFG